MSRIVRWPNWDHIKLTPKAAAYYHSTARKIIDNSGRAGAKDFKMHLRALRLAWPMYYRRKQDPTWYRPGPVVHVCLPAPTSTNSEDHWRRIKDMLPDFPTNSVAPNGNPLIHVKENAQEIEIFGENEILISMSSTFVGKNVRGGGIDILGATEVAYMKETDLTEVLLPLVIRPGFPDYYVMINSTPIGPGHWWDEAVEVARAGEGYWGDWELHEGTYADNPKTTHEQVHEYLLEKQQNIYRYRRERLGWIKQPSVDSSAIMGKGTNRAFAPETIASVLLNQKVEFRGPFVIGIDLAGAGPDALAVVVIDGQGVVCHLEKHMKSDTEYIVDLIDRLAEYWRPRAIHYDGNGKMGKEVRGKLRRANCRPVVTERRKEEFVLHLEQHFIHKSIRIPNVEFWAPGGKYQAENYNLMMRELREYREIRLQKDRLRNQKIREEFFTTFSKPPGGSDDFVDALVYASMGLNVPIKAREVQERIPEGLSVFVPGRKMQDVGISEGEIW